MYGPRIAGTFIVLVCTSTLTFIVIVADTVPSLVRSIPSQSVVIVWVVVVAGGSRLILVIHAGVRPARRGTTATTLGAPTPFQG